MRDKFAESRESFEGREWVRGHDAWNRDALKYRAFEDPMVVAVVSKKPTLSGLYGDVTVMLKSGTTKTRRFNF